jgi:hypothetical protein
MSERARDAGEDGRLGQGKRDRGRKRAQAGEQAIVSRGSAGEPVQVTEGHHGIANQVGDGDAEPGGAHDGEVAGELRRAARSDAVRMPVRMDRASAKRPAGRSPNDRSRAQRQDAIGVLMPKSPLKRPAIRRSSGRGRVEGRRVTEGGDGRSSALKPS